MKTGLSDLPAMSVKRPLLATVLNLLIVIAGLAAALGVDVRELPDVDRPVVSVTATFPGAAPETVDAEVTSVVEGAVARVSGVREIRSSSEENSSRIRIEFNPGVDLDIAAADVREAVSQVSRRLPDRVEQLTVVKADNDAESVIQLAVLSSTFNQEELTERIEIDIIPELMAVDGVASVDIYGARQRQLRVVIDPLRLSRFALTVSDVANALRQAPFDVPVGSFTSRDQQLIVRAEATAATPEQIKDVIISGDTRIGDVAEAFFAPADANSYTRLNGQPIIGLGIVRQAQSNTIDISDAILRQVEILNARNDDIDLVITSDNAEFIRGSVSEVLFSLLLTVTIVVATIWLFFGTLKATLIPSLAIPTALIGSLAGVWMMGFSINLITLLALVLATGLIVDDAIVVLENIQRLQQQGLGRKAAAVLGARQVFFAVVATTAVLVSVFVPISFLPSELGRLFREFGFVLAIAVIISTFVALTMAPAMAMRLSLAGEHRKDGPVIRAGNWLVARYRRLLGVTLSHPWKAVSVAVLAAAGAGVLYLFLPQEVAPQEDRGVVMVNSSGPDGVGLEYMERQAQQIEAILQPYVDSGEIENLFTVVGRYDPNRVRVTGQLADWSARERGPDDIVRELEGPLAQIPGSRVNAFSPGGFGGGGGGGRDGIEVALTGPDYSFIFEGARALADAIDTQSVILTDPEISYEPTQPQLSIRIDRRRAADLGVPLNQLSETLRVMVGGEDLIDLNVDDQAVPIFLESATEAIREPADLQNLYVRNNAGALLPLSAMTEIVEEGVAAELDRTEQRRAIEVEANIAAGYTISEAVAEMERLAEQTLPEGIDMLMQGEAEQLAETNRQMALTYLFAFVIVFLVLVAQFESLTSPLVVILTVPFGLAAAVYALFLTGVSLNIFSQIGLVMLIGLMAKNAILVVEFADQLRSTGKDIRAAIEEAAVLRLRPISMTLISTVLGALPLILSSGAGAESRASIGWTVFAGLGIAGLFTLLLTPVIYLGVARFGKPRSAAERLLEQEMTEAEETGAAAAARTPAQ